MNAPKHARAVLLCVVCVSAGATLGPTLATAANESFKDVFVRNTPAEPVPTQAVGTTQIAGSVSLSGTPTVSVGNTPSVAVTNTPDVTIANAAPIEVTEVGGSAETPLAHHFQFGFGSVPGGTMSDMESFAVPAGKRLSIEFVTFSDFARPVGVEQIGLVVASGGNQVTHYLATEDTPGDGDTLTQQTSIVADPGSTVRMFVRLTAPLGNESSTFFMHGSLTGTLTDA